jgi:acyl-CoA dehydrogenase
MTEPGAGSDLRSMTTRALLDGGDWVLNGMKHFISHADVADYAIVIAVTRVEDTKRGPKKQMTSFLVDKGTPGFEVRRGPTCLSHRGYHQCELTFDDVRLPQSQVLGEVHKGFDVANEWLSSTRLQVAAMCLGRAHRALELCLPWAATRKQFGQPIGKFQGTSFKLADMATDLELAELITLKTAWKQDHGQARDQDYAMAKVVSTEALGRIADHAIQIFGGMGLMDSMPLERFWRDARLERIWDGTSEIQRHIISRALLRPHEG